MSRGGQRAGAGRPKGASNKRSREVTELLQSMGVDPIVGMAHIAANDKESLGLDEDVPIAIRAQMFRELASYVAYKLKSVSLLIDDHEETHEERLARLS